MIEPSRAIELHLKALRILMEEILREGQINNAQFRAQVTNNALARIAKAREAAFALDEAVEVAELDMMKAYIHGVMRDLN